MKKLLLYLFCVQILLAGACAALDIDLNQYEMKHNRTSIYAFTPIFINIKATNPPSPAVGIGIEQALFMYQDTGFALRAEYYHFLTDVNFGDNSVDAVQAGCYKRFELADEAAVYCSLFAGYASILGSKNPKNTADAWTGNDNDHYSAKALQADINAGYEKLITTGVSAGVSVGYKTLTGSDIQIISGNTWFIGAVLIGGNVGWHW